MKRMFNDLIDISKKKLTLFNSSKDCLKAKFKKYVLGITFGVEILGSVVIMGPKKESQVYAGPMETTMENQSNGYQSCNYTVSDDLSEEDLSNNNGPIHEFIGTTVSVVKDKVSNQMQYDLYLGEYSYYFNMNSAKVISMARELTNNYTNGFYGIINDQSYDLSNPETACMAFVYLLQRDQLSIPLADLGLTYEDLLITDEIVKIIPEDGEQLILRNGEIYSQFVGRICDMLGVDKCCALAISYAEIGTNGSDLSKNKNNFGGVGGNATFVSPEAGIISFCFNLKKYENYNIHSIEELSGIYVNGNRNKPSEVWINNVRCFYNKIRNNQQEYFSMESTDNKNKILSLSI